MKTSISFFAILLFSTFAQAGFNHEVKCQTNSMKLEGVLQEGDKIYVSEIETVTLDGKIIKIYGDKGEAYKSSAPAYVVFNGQNEAGNLGLDLKVDAGVSMTGSITLTKSLTNHADRVKQKVENCVFGKRTDY